MKAPKNADQKPIIWKPGTSFDANKNIRALIISVNRPKVNIFIGKVSKIKIGFITTFIKPITTAAKSAVLNPANVIPGTIQAINSNEAAYKTHLINISMSNSPIILNNYILIYN